MELKVGGIYTNTKDEEIYIILKKDSSKYYYFILNLNCNNREELVRLLNTMIPNLEKYATALEPHSFLNWMPKGIFLECINDLDGYLGLIPEDIFRILQTKLKAQPWYL